MDKQDFSDLKKRFEKDSVRKKRIGYILNYLSILTAVISFIIFISYLLGFYNDSKLTVNLEASKVVELQSEIINLNKIISQFKRVEGKAVIGDTIFLTNKKILSIEQKLENLNNIILDNPEKAISIPLLKNEVENLKLQNKKTLMR